MLCNVDAQNTKLVGSNSRLLQGSGELYSLVFIHNHQIWHFMDEKGFGIYIIENIADFHNSRCNLGTPSLCKNMWIEVYINQKPHVI